MNKTRNDHVITRASRKGSPAYKTALLNKPANRKARRNAAHVLARLDVLAVTSVNPPPLTDDQILAALNPPTESQS